MDEIVASMMNQVYVVRVKADCYVVYIFFCEWYLVVSYPVVLLGYWLATIGTYDNVFIIATLVY